MDRKADMYCRLFGKPHNRKTNKAGNSQCIMSGGTLTVAFAGPEGTAAECCTTRGADDEPDDIILVTSLSAVGVAVMTG